MQPDDLTKQGPDEINPQPALNPEQSQFEKQGKRLAKVAAVTVLTFAALLFALTPKSDGHGARHSSRERSAQLQAAITRTLHSENPSTDDASANQH